MSQGFKWGQQYQRAKPQPPNDPAETQISVNLGQNARYVGNDNIFAIWGATRSDGKGASVVLKGALANRSGGEMLICKGFWQEHPTHGWSFNVSQCRSGTPKTAEGVVKFLVTRVKGIGPVFAQAIVDTFGAEKAFDVIDADPNVLHQIKTSGGRSISKAQVDSIINAWEDVRQIREIETFLYSHDVDQWLAAKLYDKYGHEVIGVLTNDPYRITSMRGVGFKTADKIALAMGTPIDDPRRLQAGILFVLSEAEDKSGNSYLTSNSLVSYVSEMLGVSDVMIIADACRQLAVEEKIVVEDDSAADQRIYRSITHSREVELSRRVRSMVESAPVIESNLERPTPPEGMTANEARAAGIFIPTGEQWDAVSKAFASRLTVITGGPGVGKTAVVQAILEAADAARIHTELGAPTGKAARRMTELTGRDARTIHKLLEWSPQNAMFMRDNSNPLSAGLVIIDETSMLSLDLCLKLIRAIGPMTHLVLVGDVDQLPPIGAGKPLDDIINSGAVPTTRLTRIFRQAAKSMIVTNAHRMNRYHPSENPTEPYFSNEEARAGENDPEMLRDFWWIGRKDKETITPTIVEVFSQRIPRLADMLGLKLDPFKDVMVLAPQNPGPAGIGAINEALQEALNPKGKLLPGPHGIRIGDRIQQQKNNYDLGIMNGETAQVIYYDEVEKMVTLRLDDAKETKVTASILELDTFKIAYAMTVHKSQGSQFKCVIVVCTMSHYRMLTKSLLYTAVTRASDVCVMVGEKHALVAGIKKPGLNRNSLLSLRIRNPEISGDLF